VYGFFSVTMENMSPCSTFEYSCWVTSFVLIAVIVYLGCAEMRKDSHPPVRGVASARVAKVDKRQSARSARREYYGRGEELPRIDDDSIWGSQNGKKEEDTGMQTLGFPASWESKAEHDSKPRNSKLDSDFASQTDDKHEAMPTVSKESAMAGANSSPSDHSESERSSGGHARTVGLKGLGETLRPPPAFKTGSKCISFMDSDARQMEHNRNTDCLKKENCPWTTS